MLRLRTNTQLQGEYRMSYRLTGCQTLAQRCDLRDKIILELGSDLELDGARILTDMGARLVIASNVRPIAKEKIPSKAIFEQLDARELRTSIGTGTVDAVIAVAFIEHAHDLDLVFNEVSAVLKEGGTAVIGGGPIWSGRSGHHVWVTTGDGTQYRFTTDNPIPAWGHLLYDRAEMVEYLSSRVPLSHIDPIVDWVYSGPALNRLSRRDIIATAQSSPLRLAEIIDTRHRAPDAHTLATLNAKAKFEEDWEVSGLQLVFTKRSSIGEDAGASSERN
jgi:SAM-dependent methyltransferase